MSATDGEPQHAAPSACEDVAAYAVSAWFASLDEEGYEQLAYYFNDGTLSAVDVMQLAANDGICDPMDPYVQELILATLKDGQAKLSADDFTIQGESAHQVAA